jgi:serine/threonine protein kinase
VSSVQARFGGRYELVAALGVGGMGHVYRAIHHGLGKEIALKVLSGMSPELLARFHREAQAIARLDHPGCVRVLDFGVDTTGAPYLAMELLDGVTLADEIARQGKLPLLRAVHLAQQLVAALAHAHAHGVIHRDVKPGNVMLARGGSRAVLIDFGLASLRDAPALTGAGMAMGSPSYIAPERLLGHTQDARSDLYSAGVVLYEMLAGARPIVGSSPREIMEHALHRPARPLGALRPDVPPLLDALVRRALAKDPAKRFPDAEAMRSALDEVEEQIATTGYPAFTDEEPGAHSSTMLQIAVTKVSLWSRLWSWLCYGRWRWRPT